MVETASIPGKVGGVIPHFFYDVMGRIVPGVFLVVGACWIWSSISADDLMETVAVASLTDLVSVVFILFILGYFLGFLLSSLSYWAFEWSWGKLSPWNMARLRRELGHEVDTESQVEKSFRDRFHFSIVNDHKKILLSSWLCAYALWDVNQHLGILASRWDAEALASRNFALGALILSAISACEGRSLGVLVFSLIWAAAVSAYSYHRRKQVFGRFELFLVLRDSERT